jgi:hypothetical protein
MNVSARTNKFFFRSVTAAGLLSAAAIIASAIPASAAAYVALTSGLGIHNDFTCAVATHNVTAVPLSTAANGCANRVWLHGIGFSYCISGHTEQNVPTRYHNPQTAQISANTAPC